MNETTRTLTFVGVAALLAAVAFGMHAASQPPSLEEFSDVGEEFYPDFKDPADATGLRVAAYNEDAARVDVFNVEFKNGLWRIPSHHDYPADGEEQLAKTATSIIGLKRDALASTSKDDHKRLGVLDPLDETITGTSGRGDRISLTKGDTTLADYIIGTKVEDGPENTFHVRRADEDRTYRVTLDLDVSTKFADWIEPDLLDFRRGDIRELVIDRYSIDESRGVLVPGTQSQLTRASQDDEWKLEGIDPAKEKVKVSTVNQIINALEDLKIVGVRPKPAGLSADLRGEGDGAIDARAVFDLEQKGFFIDSRGALVSNEGDVRMATADGAMYVLRFGEVFTGSDVEIEIGKSDTGDSPEEKSADDENAKQTDAAGEDQDDAGTDATVSDDEATDNGDDAVKKSRYVFITAQFDESMIESLPEKPVKPEPPAGVDSESDADSDKKQGEVTAEGEAEKADDNESTDENAKADTEDGAKAENAADAKDEGQEEQPDPMAEYEKALAEYETALKDWEAQQKSREEKIEAGRKRVQELNNRFADWYYVISAETFDDIRVSPEDLIEEVKSEESDASSTEAGAAPAGTVAPAEKEMKEATEPAAETDNQNSGDEKESEEKAADPKAAEDDAADQKPAEETANEKPAEADASSESAGDKPAEETPSENDETPAADKDNSGEES